MVVSGLLTSTSEHSGAIVNALITNKDFVAAGSAARAQLVKRLATVVGVRGDVTELSQLLTSLAGGTTAISESSNTWWQAAAISGLGQGLPRYRGDLKRLSLPLLLKMQRPHYSLGLSAVA